jgi:hypothetical protein
MSRMAARMMLVAAMAVMLAACGSITAWCNT